MTKIDGMKILQTSMGENDADAETIGEYLIKLSATCWDEEDGFSGKRPFGNSGWVYELYTALAHAYPEELKVVWYDYEDDFSELQDFDKKVAIEYINTAYQALYKMVLNEDRDSQ